MGRYERDLSVGRAPCSPTYFDLMEYVKPLLEHHQRITARTIADCKKELPLYIEENRAETYLEMKHTIAKMLRDLEGITSFVTFTREEMDLGIRLPEIEYFNPDSYPEIIRARVNGVCPDKHGGFFRMDFWSNIKTAIRNIQEFPFFRLDKVERGPERMQFSTLAKGRVWPAEADADIGGDGIDNWKILALYIGHYLMHGQLVEIRTNALIDHISEKWKKTPIVHILGEKYRRLRKVKGKKGKTPHLTFLFENSKSFNVPLGRRRYYYISASGNHVWSGANLLLSREVGTDKIMSRDPV